jgi:hypothetical protein
LTGNVSDSLRAAQDGGDDAVEAVRTRAARDAERVL